MLDRLTDLAQWWRDLPPDLAFLFALPFGLAAAALAIDFVRRRWRQRARHRPRISPR